jgi:hypothetical protein
VPPPGEALAPRRGAAPYFTGGVKTNGAELGLAAGHRQTSTRARADALLQVIGPSVSLTCARQYLARRPAIDTISLPRSAGSRFSSLL